MLKAPATEVRRIAELGRAHASEIWLAEVAASSLTLIKWPLDAGADCAHRFSQALGVRALHLWHEDTSAWAGYTFFIDGEREEAFEFGPNDEESDYSAEASGHPQMLKPIKCKGWTQAARDDKDDFHYFGAPRLLDELRPGWEFIIRRVWALDFALPDEYPREQAVRLTPP